MFGLPKDCVHQNAVHPCVLSFSCWLEGGRQADGNKCGSNEWLFSCCIRGQRREKAKSETGLMGTNTVDVAEVVPPTSFNRNKHVIKANYLYKNEIDLPVRMPQQRTTPNYRYKYYYRMKPNMLRRRIDDEPVGVFILVVY